MEINALAGRVLTADAAMAAWLNARARRSALVRLGVSRAAVWLAPLEVLLMIGVALTGKVGVATRMLAAVGVVYLASEVLGMAWRRERPFVCLAEVEALVPHAADRSFPSRHVASGLAMAGIACRTGAGWAGVMASVAWLLGASRAAAGLHFPVDVLAGAVLGMAVGRLLGGA